MAMRFIVHSSARNISEIVQRIRRAEELGYEGVFLADSHMRSLDPFQAMAVAARETRKILLGTAVTNIVYRDPTLVAGSFATLNEISGGRAIVGLGTGDGPVVSQGKNPTSLGRFEAGLAVIRELLHGRAVAVPTGKIALGIGRLPVPIYLSMEGPRGLQVAGRLADGIIFGSGFDLSVLQWARERIAAGAKETGRALADIDIMAAGMVFVDQDGDRARFAIRRRLANRAHHNFRYTLETVPPEEVDGVKIFMAAFEGAKTRPIEERIDPALVTDYLARRFSIAGTPEECIERLEILAAAGIRRVMVTPPDSAFDEIMERWGKEVMPHFQ
ncbi:MAG: LLM class flavin-dependent oxidoreductase [Deltaproteobacteria bacterium]|nr:LLM class flavin-dependent oxidoreductase [Deltaproteobacteria bacterium]